MFHISSLRRLAAVALFVAPLGVVGQTTPQTAKTSATQSFSAFLFGSDAARKTQMLYLPSDLPGGTAGRIHRVYFQHASTNSTVTLGKLRLTLGHTTNTAFVPVTRFYAGQDTVLKAATYTIAPGAVLGEWFGIDLDTVARFSYDPTRTLIVGVSFATSTNQAFGTFGDNTFGTSPGAGKKLYAAADTASRGLTGSSTWQHFGFDNRPVGLARDLELTSPLLLFPNPAADRLTVVLPETTAPAILTLTDALGRVVVRRETPATALRTGEALDLRTLPAGAYALTVAQGDRRTTRRVVHL